MFWSATPLSSDAVSAHSDRTSLASDPVRIASISATERRGGPKSPAEECSPRCCRCPLLYTHHRHRNRWFVLSSRASHWAHCRRHWPSSDIWHKLQDFPHRRNCSARRRHRRNRASRLSYASRACPAATTEEAPPFPAWSRTSQQSQPG